MTKKKITQGNTNTIVFWSIFYMISHENALKSAKQEIKKMISKYNKTDLDFTREQLDEMTFLSQLRFKIKVLLKVYYIIKQQNCNQYFFTSF